MIPIPLPKTILLPKMWKKMRNFEKLSGAWDLKILKMHGEVKNSKFENYIKWEPMICRLTRGFWIWPQNWNRIKFDPLLGQKNSNLKIFWGFFQKSLDLTVFWPNRGSNVIGFELCGQIWNPLIILHIIGPNLVRFSDLDFLTSPCIFKIFKSQAPLGFWKFWIFFHIFGMIIWMFVRSRNALKAWNYAKGITSLNSILSFTQVAK